MSASTALEDTNKITTEKKTPSKEWKSTDVVCNLSKMMTTINNRDQMIAIMIDRRGDTATTIMGILLLLVVGGGDIITTVETTTTMTAQTTPRATTYLPRMIYILETMTFIDLLLTTIQAQYHHSNTMEGIEGKKSHFTVVHPKTRMRKEDIEDKRTIIVAMGAAAENMIAEVRCETTANLQGTATMSSNTNKITATKIATKA
jgi:hypothetical protein